MSCGNISKQIFKVSKPIAFALNSFKGSKEWEHAAFFFFFKGVFFRWGIGKKTCLAEEHEVCKMCWLPTRGLT